METSTPVQSYRAQPPIIDEDASLSPVALSGQDTSGGSSVEQDTNPTKVSGGVKVLEITPVKSESESLDGKKVLCQTRDLTRALIRQGIISRASSNPELSISLSENYFCGGHPIKPKLRRPTSLDNICRAMSPWNEENAYEEFKRLHEQARENDKQSKKQISTIHGKKEKIIDTSGMKEQNTAISATPERVLSKRFSSIIIGQDASPRTLNSPATPLPRPSAKRALLISPGTEMSPARRYSFSNMSDASPILRKNTVCLPKEKLQSENGNAKNWLMVRASSQQRNRSYTMGDMRPDARRIKTPTSRRNKEKCKKTKTVVDITQPKIYEVVKKVQGGLNDEKCEGADIPNHTTEDEC